jgi:hypothetical protein
MKKWIILVLVSLFLYGSVRAQEDPRFMREGAHRGRLAELEKIKLIETLQMDEETTLRFFSRRTEHMEEQKKLMDARREILEEMEIKFKNEENLSDDEYKANVEKLIQTEKQALDNRISFYKSLDDILTPEQIAKLAVFEFSFMKEIRNVMRKGREKGEYK